MRIALVQMPVTADKKENLLCAEACIESAAKAKADIVVLPEMFNCPYSSDYFPSFAEIRGEESWQCMSKAAKRHGIYLVGGSMPERDRGSVYNTSFVFDRNGEEIACHRKMHLFDVEIENGQRFYESETLSPGDSVTVFDTEFCKMGLCICFDFRFPELSRLMALKGAKMVLVPAAFNMTTGPAHWETLFRQRAVDDQVYTVGVAPARDEQGCYVSYGNSIICSPWGKMVCRAGAGPKIVHGVIDLDEVERIRKQLPLLSARRDDIYCLKQKGSV